MFAKSLGEPGRVGRGRARGCRLLDSEQEEALRSAFAEIKLGEQRAAREAAGTGGFESGTLKAGSRLGYELRSFAQGARDALEQIAQSVYNRALLDAKLAVTTAEYLLRRAIFDSGRVLSAASAAIRPTIDEQMQQLTKD